MMLLDNNFDKVNKLMFMKKLKKKKLQNYKRRKAILKTEKEYFLNYLLKILLINYLMKMEHALNLTDQLQISTHQFIFCLESKLKKIFLSIVIINNL
jgi:hypothetical protein